ncbi:MAG: site-specific integrase [Chloroflexales bacterium]|nr:site-specific integrase [Chloroflexales bacterium]
MSEKRRGRGEGSIFKREDGIWCASITIGVLDGKRRRKFVYGKTRKEVVEKLQALQRAHAAGVTFTKLTVKEFLEQWLEQTVKRKNRVRTYDKYAEDIEHHLIPALGHHQLAKLTPSHVQALLNQLADANLSHRSIRNVRAVLRCALNQALRFGYVTRNVATLIDVPGDVTFKPVMIDEEQARRLIEATRGHRFEVPFRVALGLGLRKGEILGLRWEDVDLTAATIKITGSLQRQRGKLERSGTKTEASVRTIALPPTLLAMLRAHHERQALQRTVAPRWTDSGLVFTSSVGTAIEPSDLSRAFKKVLKRAELSEDFRFHDLRHACATFLIVMGAHPRVVMEILGHSQIGTTMNIYAHVLPRIQRDAVTGLDALFAEPDQAASEAQEGDELDEDELDEDELDEDELDEDELDEDELDEDELDEDNDDEPQG